MKKKEKEGEEANEPKKRGEEDFNTKAQINQV